MVNDNRKIEDLFDFDPNAEPVEDSEWTRAMDAAEGDNSLKRRKKMEEEVLELFSMELPRRNRPGSRFIKDGREIQIAHDEILTPEEADRILDEARRNQRS